MNGGTAQMHNTEKLDGKTISHQIANAFRKRGPVLYIYIINY